VRLELVPTLLGRQPWPLLLVASLVGWTALIGLQHSLLVPEICSVMEASWPNLDARTIDAVLLVNSPLGLAVSWLVMLLAMMPLLLAQPMLHLWVRSLARRRMRAIAAFLIAYFAVWMAAGPILLAIAVAVRMATKGSDVLAVALALVLALLWRVCPLRQVCLNRCHLLPRLSPFGLAADRDCLRFGARTGAWCVGSCWALMVVPLVVDGLHLVAMLGVMLLMLNERLAPTRPVRWRWRRSLAR
jgi:predicted metal-binding membrane protein